MKPKVIQKLDGINVIIRLWVQNHLHTFKATSTTVLYGLSFQILEKMLNQEELRSIILLSGDQTLTKERTLKDYFYLEMALQRVINDIMQNPQKKCISFSFQFVVLSLIALDN